MVKYNILDTQKHITRRWRTMRRKVLIVLCCVLVVMLALPVFSYAREASDTTLYVNSDTTDIYSSSVKKIYEKTFTTLDAYTDMSDWTISGAYTHSDAGLVMNDATAGIIYNAQEYSGKYGVKYFITNKAETAIEVYFNYQDAGNYYSLIIDSYDGATLVNKVVDSTTTVLASGLIEELKIARGNSMDITLEITVDDGDNISAWYTIGDNKVTLCKNMEVPGDKLTSGKVGVGLMYNNQDAVIRSINVYRMPEDDITGIANTVRGKIVTYKDMGDALVAVAFYKNGQLVELVTKGVSLFEGINDFSVDVQSDKNLAGTKVRCFLFDNISNIKPLVVTGDNSDYRNEGFSDALEPYYPMASAASKTFDDMYALVSDSTIEANSTDEEIADRKAVIDMYKKAGFDITADLNDNISSMVLRAHAPQTYSHLTPKPLMGDYAQPYSIDAAWNNPIPKDNPRTEITSWTTETKDSSGNVTGVKTAVSFQFTAVRPKGAINGNGLGIPIIIADEDDGYENFASKYNTNYIVTITGAKIRVPENYGDMLNDISTGDRHGVFIDDVSKMAVHTWHTVASNSIKGYDLASGLVKDFDARAGSHSSYIDLTGIGNEMHAGVNAAGIPMDAITIKAADLDDNGEDIKHALGAALGTTMRARVYPAYDMDSGIMSNTSAVGCIPYGGIIQLDPSIDLEAIYADGKLSLPGYKILKAWRDYGMYNVDQSTAGLSRGSLLIYSSAAYDDWADASKTVPYSNSVQGYGTVQAEITAFIEGNSFFGLTKPVSFYVTTPVVKKTSYDADNNGEVSSSDVDFIEENIGKVITLENETCDINKDGEITERDTELVNRYIGGSYPHSPKTYSITTRYSANTGWAGNVNVTGLSSKTNYNGNGTAQANIVSYTKQIPENDYYAVAAVPSNGYVFDGWVNEELAGETSNVIVRKATSDAYYSAKFKLAPSVKVVLEKNEDGEGTVGFTATKSGGYSTRAYGTLADIKYGNYQCAFRATPAEGYIFESWEVTADGVTKTYHSNILNALINADTTIKANFIKATAYDVFDSLDTSVWSPVTGSTEMLAYVSGGQLKFSNAVDGIESYTILNNSVLSLGNTTLLVSVKGDNNVNNNRGRVIFGYKDEKNYWFVDFSSKTEEIRLMQKVNGSYKIHATYTPDEADTLDLTANADIHITTTKDGKITVYIYQGENEYMLADNFDAGEVIVGKMGLGVSHARHIIFDNFALIAN